MQYRANEWLRQRCPLWVNRLNTCYKWLFKVQMKHKLTLIFSAAVFVAGFCTTGALASSNGVAVGVLAIRGDETCIQMWTPTIRYLTENIVGNKFYLVPLDLDEISGTLEQRKVDFVLTNPGNYVELERRFGVTRIATLRNLRHSEPYTLFGAVIFVRADREDISELSDLKDGSFGAVHEDAFGGFQMAWRELRDVGIDPFRDFSHLQFLGFPQDNVVLSVRDGEIDAGTVRTDILERMADEGQIRLEDFHILNAQTSEDFPFRHSTRLYPEWAFAKASDTSDELGKSVAIALMKMPSNHPAAAAGKYAGWTVPLDYQPVHELFRDLEIGPYRKSGRIPVLDVIKQYWRWFALIAAIILFTMFHNILVKRQVRLRTRELSHTNRALENEVIERKRAEEEAQANNEENRRLTSQLINIREAEHRALARELHDEMGQCLTTIKTDAILVKEQTKRCPVFGHGDSCPKEIGRSAEEIVRVTEHVYDIVHNMMRRLRPHALDDLGLEAALQSCISLARLLDHGILCHHTFSGRLDTLGEQVNITLYRVLQEALTNVAKHAHAKNVWIEVAKDENIEQDKSREVIRMRICDDGQGMDVKAKTSRFGLIGLRERLRTVNGTFRMDSEQGKGTCVTVAIPVDGKAIGEVS